MARWSIPEMGMRAPQGVHLLLAVGLPTLTASLGEFWLTGRVALGPWCCAFLYSVVLALWSPWRLRTRQSGLLKLWFWVVATLALWVALALLEGLPWPRTLTVEGAHLVWFLVAFAQGQVAVLWAGQLASRSRLFQLIEGIPEGRALEERMRDFQLDADFSRGNHAALAGSLLLLAAGAVVLTVISPLRLTPVSMGLLAGFLALCTLVGVLLRVYRREMHALMYGRRLPWSAKLAPLGWSSLLLVAAGLAAAALMTLGGPWFDATRGVTVTLQPPPEVTPAAVPRLPEISGEGDYRLLVLLTLLGLIFQLHHIGLLVGLVIQIVLWSAPWLVVAFLVWPLVRWVATGGRETKGLGRRWWERLRAQWRAFWAALGQWWQGDPHAPVYALGNTGAREWILSLLGKPSGRRPYPAVVEAFLRVVKWAEPVCPYHRGETTREFFNRLSERLPDSPELPLLRDLLDEELFGARGLSAQEREGLLALVQALLAQPPSHDEDPGVS